ncbi:mitochondrial ribonuclease P protein 1 homolog [Elysia marginata]|uniref:RNA (guanine-9-)-methyltransferase domain-containing protein 1 n=1 Tax=Elysia marginata TaxID=1093978 RepID=A0AAV4GJR5_9GAST|nr:mitochondrial ribonuclease P protein 1 homolog [Elysia marginata]
MRNRVCSNSFWSKIFNTFHALAVSNEPCNWLTYCKKVRLYSTLKQSVVHDLCADIAVDEIKAKHRHEARGTSCVADSVQAEVERRLDDAIKRFSERELRFLKIVQLEHSFLFSEGYAIPSPECLFNRNWLEAMTMSSMEERLKYYVSLERMVEKQRQSESKEVMRESSETDTDGENAYSIFLQHLSPTLEERLVNHRLASAMLHGSPLVVDLGYDEHQLSTDVDPLVSQLWNLYLVNAANSEPFHLVFTNCNFSGPTYRHLLLTCLVKRDHVLATFTKKSHTEIFPPESLVYLSSQAKQVLSVFNSNRIYVVGAYHDPMVHKKLSLAKARQEKLSCLKLPIDQHVKWGHQAHKDLDLDSVVGVLLSARQDGLWKKAFVSVVPSLVNPNELLNDQIN